MSPIESLAASLEQHAQYVLQAAANTPPGGGAAWDAVLANYRIPPFPPDERAASVQNLRMTRGALPGEVRAVLSGLSQWATGELARMRQDPSLAAHPAIWQ